MSAVRDAIDDIRSIDGKAVAGDITAAVSGKANAAEVTTDDWVDSYAPGITVNQTAASNMNVNGATYIYLAIV